MSGFGGHGGGGDEPGRGGLQILEVVSDLGCLELALADELVHGIQLLHQGKFIFFHQNQASGLGIKCHKISIREKLN
jgi:hypothetical protein